MSARHPRPLSTGGRAPRRGRLASSLWLALALAVPAGAAVAQQYPSRAIRMLVPAGPGGGADTTARVVGQSLSDAVGQPVVIDNRPGAGTMLASEMLATAPADGYTVLMATNSHAINASLHKKRLRYDPVNDFATVTLVSRVPYFVVVHPSVPAKSVKELIALAKRRPGDLLFASAGTGSGTHLAGELFSSMADIKMVHVPHKGGSAAMVDLIGGHVQVMISNTINSSPHVAAGRLRALAITSLERSPLYPQLPTVAEAGVPGYQADVWYGVMVPARTPPEIVGRLHREVVAILKTKPVADRFKSLGAEVIGSSGEEFASVLKGDIQKWARVTARLQAQMK